MMVAAALELSKEAIRVAPCSPDTLPVEMLNVAVVAFAATVTEDGAFNKSAAQLVNVTTAPPTGAWFDRVTVQTPLALDPSALGVHCSDVTVTDAWKLIVVDAVDPLREPVRVAVGLPAKPLAVPAFMTAVDADAAGPVEMLKVLVVALATTETVAGTVKIDAALFASVTTTPPAGAGCNSVTVHVVLEFGPNDVAAQFSPPTAGACKNTVAVAVVPLRVPVSVAV